MTQPHHYHHSQRGVTLVELLIATAIGVLITLAITLLLRQTMRTSVTTQQTTRLTEASRQTLETLLAGLTEAQYVTTARADTLTIISRTGDPVTYQWIQGRLFRNQQPLGDPNVQVMACRFNYFRAETKGETGGLTSVEGLVEEPLGADPASEVTAVQRERIRLIKIHLSLKEGDVTQHLVTAAALRLTRS